jgi:hypothetical protein
VDSKLRRTSAVVAVLVFVGVLLQPFGGDAAAGSNGHDEMRKGGLRGVWRVTTTPRNCVTGVPIPTAAFEGLFTFHKDGTMSAWVQNATITTTRSPSHGLWRREHGGNDHALKFVHLRYSPATGMFLGRQESSGILELGENGDEFTTDSSTVVFDVNGNPGVPSCANSVGIRFEIDE